MILSTSAHMACYIKHTQMHQFIHTHHTDLDTTWVVKLVVCIGGIDLFGIRPCHCCHLNVGLGKSPNHTPMHHKTSTISFVCMSLIRVENGWDTVHGPFHIFMVVAALPNHCSLLQLLGKMSREREKKKKTVLSHFCKCSSLIS